MENANMYILYYKNILVKHYITYKINHRRTVYITDIEAFGSAHNIVIVRAGIGYGLTTYICIFD